MTQMHGGSEAVPFLEVLDGSNNGELQLECEVVKETTTYVTVKMNSTLLAQPIIITTYHG